MLGAALCAVAISACPAIAQAPPPAPADEATTILRQVIELDRTGKYADALPLATKALELREAALPAGHADIAWAVHWVAYLNQRLGRLSDAHAQYVRVVEIREKTLPAGHVDIAVALNNLATILQLQTRYAEAEPLFFKALAIREKALPAGDPAIAHSIASLAALYDTQGRLADAERLYVRALDMREKVLAPDHRDIVWSLNSLATSFARQGRNTEAEPLLRRVLSAREKSLPADHPDIAASLNNLAMLLWRQGRYAEAEPLFRRALTMREKALPAGHPDIAQSLSGLAAIHESQGRFTEAEQLHQRALEMREKALAPAHPDIAWSIHSLSILHLQQGRFAEAEQLQRRTLELRQKVLPPGHPDIAWSLANLALVLAQQARFAEAEPLYKEALAIRERTLAPTNSDIALNLHNLGAVYMQQGRFEEAEALFRRALGIREKAFPHGHPDIASSYNALAVLYWRQKRNAEAEPLLKRALEMRMKLLPTGHPELGHSYNNLAHIYYSMRRYTEALPLAERALELKRSLPAGHPSTALSLMNVGGIYHGLGRMSEAEPRLVKALAMLDAARPPGHHDILLAMSTLIEHWEARGQWSEALALARRAANAAIERAATEAAGAAGSVGLGASGLEGTHHSEHFHAVARVAHRVATLPSADPATVAALRDEAFRMSQWSVQTGAAGALTQMAARFGGGTTGLGDLLRERQDLAAEWTRVDKALSTALSQPPSERHGSDERAKVRLEAIDNRVMVLDQRLKVEFPSFAALARPEPMGLGDAAKLVGTGEALVFLQVGPEESFVYAVTREGVDWHRLDIKAADLGRRVVAFRQGLDVDDPEAAIRAGSGFDLDAAAALHALLLGPVERLIREKPHLIIVPSGPLTSLPFHLFVTEPPVVARPPFEQIAFYRDAAWLVRRQAVTVLPSVSSLKALRVLARGSRAPRALIGFADPVYQRGQPALTAVATARGGARVRTRSFESYWRGSRADLDALRRGLTPLPESATELRTVARRLAAPDSDLRLGVAASETMVKRTRLAEYRIVYFATHGLVAGELTGLPEPALALTIPDEPSELDDGLLTASEVATLKLNADWVVLSACNTAAGDKPGAEALSGLTRAFFYAGARALLVSHWEVDSHAAVRLTTSTFAALERAPGIGRAEALRRAMLAYQGDTSSSLNAYPSLWGAFAVVGEGG